MYQVNCAKLASFGQSGPISDSIYSRTSMARTSLGPWKFVRDMGSSSHRGLIMAPIQEANSDNLGYLFDFLHMIVCCVSSSRRFL